MTMTVSVSPFSLVVRDAETVGDGVGGGVTGALLPGAPVLAGPDDEVLSVLPELGGLFGSDEVGDDGGRVGVLVGGVLVLLSGGGGELVGCVFPVSAELGGEGVGCDGGVGVGELGLGRDGVGLDGALAPPPLSVALPPLPLAGPGPSGSEMSRDTTWRAWSSSRRS